LYRLEERNDLWENLSSLPSPYFDVWDRLVVARLLVSLTYFGVLGVPVTIFQQHIAHDVELASPFWVVLPTSLDHVPNRALQPSILTWVRWAGRPRTTFDVIVYRVVITIFIWQYVSEDLMMSG